MYPKVPPSPSYPEIEKRILAYWKQHKIFEKSINSLPSTSQGGNEFVFYDGPPFANGLPHYGHLLTGYAKDVVPRFQTMRGRRVERRFGWDCHGLPAEMEAEKELKVSGRQQIQEVGIDKFNEYCRTSVLRYTKEWEHYVTRQARWVSFENDYKTMDLSYMESVVWAFKSLFDKGLIYEGYKVMPYSWACETPLSNFEIRLDNATRERQDPALTVSFTLKPTTGDPLPLKILAWTTTPWTLPSNLALAVGPEIDYVIVEKDGAGLIIAEAALEKYSAELKDPKIIGKLKGSELIERGYEPLFPYFSKHPNSFRILSGEFVGTEDGTGVVHMAPGFGEDDQKVCEANGISLVVPVDVKGQFTSEVSEYEGQLVFDANKNIIKDLKAKGVVLRHETYLHNYPHCWRTDTPIIYKALNSWYVRVTDFKDRMVELNQQINWIPSHIKDGQFGKWLSNARDWSISRSRFWGTPIPVWRSDNPKFPRIDVYGSIKDLEKDFGVKVEDLHRPFIDSLVRPNPDDPSGKSMMRRVEDVFDCWFESGSMPFAQVHYPFENKEWFEQNFPADYIVEYVAQTRGWFYTLMVLATALFDKPPFRNCMCHGVVLDEKGQKLSKRLRNYPDPEEVFEKIGSDALRWFLVSSPVLRGGDLLIDKEGKGISEIVRTILNPIWNSYYFFSLYANTDNIKAEFNTKSPFVLDKYILSKTGDLVRKLTKQLESYELSDACETVLQFMDALNNWYIRRSRDRFWKNEKDDEKMWGYHTLYSVLVTLTKCTAPLLPLMTEEIYRGLTGEESVHLSGWPDHSAFPQDDSMVAAMDKVREVCSAGLSLREKFDLRTRLPLQSVTFASPVAKSIAPFSSLITDELNVKQLKLLDSVEEIASFKLELNSRNLGKKLGEKFKNVLGAAKAGKWSKNPDGTVTIGEEVISKDDFTLSLVAKEGLSAQALPDNSAVVILDTKLTPALEQEGFARDLVRLIQQARKDAGLHVSDHIKLSIEAPADLTQSFHDHNRYIADQTLAKEIVISSNKKFSFAREVEVNKSQVSISLERMT